MTTYRNTAKGTRGILVKGNTYEFLAPGQVKAIPAKRVRAVPDGIIEVDPSDIEPDDSEPLPPPPTDLVDDGPEGEKPLSDLKRDELDRLAEKEGIDVSLIEGSGQGGNVLKDDVIAAIEAKRKASANG